MSFSFTCSLKNDLKKSFLQEFIFDVLSNDQSLALLFLPTCSFENLSQLFRAILCNIPINDDTLNIRWSIQSFIGSSDYQSENDMSNELSMTDFLSLNDQAINFIKKYLNFTGEIKKGIAHDLSFYIQLLRDDYPGIFYSILPKLQDIISKINIDRVYKAIGPNFITFYLNIPIDFVNQINEFDEQELPSFFQFHNNFTQTEITFLLQKKITNAFSYPTSIKGLENSINFTLVNSSLCTNKSFIDTVYEVVEKAIGSQVDYKKIIKLIEPVFDFFPYFAVANQTILLREKNQYLQQLVKMFDNNLPHSHIIECFHNDFHFLNFISSQTGKRFGYGDFFIDSFPFLLKTVIQNTEEIIKFSQLKFLAIKKDKADIDFDFVRSYGILYQFFSFCKNSQIPTSTHLNTIASKISKLLNSISNEQTKSKIIIDLFSCIFVQDKSGQFICHPLLAQQIISVLISFTVPSQIYRANVLFNNKRITKSDNSIVPWLDNKTSYIYSAVESKNWQMAEKLTAFLPYYIKLYSEAMDADKYLNESYESVTDLVKVNVLLSQQTQKEKLIEIQQKTKFIDPINTIINYRLSKDSELDNLCSICESNSQCQQVNDFAYTFDESLETSLKKIKNYPQDHSITSMSKHFDGFLSYLYKYYRCAILIDSSTFDSIEDLFKLNFQKAIEGSIAHDQMAGAEELTKYVNIDLSKYVFENLSYFDINSNLIESLAEKFPLESTALSISNHIASNLPPKMKRISDYFFFLEEVKSQKECLHSGQKNLDDKEDITIDSILGSDFNDFEDLVFLVDHNELYHQMLIRFDNETISTKYYKLFCFISYVSPEEDQKRIKSIEVYHQIYQITAKRDSFDILTDLYEKGSQYFSLIIDYISYWIQSEEQSSLILKLFNLSLGNVKNIDIILQSFPEHFDVIMARNYYQEGVLPLLIKYAPAYKVQFLKIISMLPKEIFHDSNIFDIDSIARSYIRYPYKILKMPKAIANYFSDENLIKILKGTLSLSYSNHIFLYLYHFFQNKSTMIEFWSDIIDNKLKTMEIESYATEDEAVKFFHQIKEPLDTIDHPKFKQYRSLSRIVELRPFLHYRISYSFAKLRHPDFLSNILLLCSKIDNENVILDLSKSFGIELDKFFFNRVHLQLILGDFINAMETVQQKNLKIDKYSNQKFYDSSFYFLYPLYKTPIFNYANKNDNNDDKNVSGDEIFLSSSIPDDAFKSVNSFLAMIPKGVKKNERLLKSPEAKRTLIFLISKHCSIGPALSLLISFQQFDLAYELFNSIDNKEEKINHFIHNICFPAIFNNLGQKLTDFIMRIDKNLEKTSFLWDFVIDFFTKNEMPQGLIFALQIENKLEDAAIIGLDSLKTSVSYLMGVTILGNIIINLKTSINYRKSFIKSNKINEKTDDGGKENQIEDESQNVISEISSSSSASYVPAPVVINQTKTNDDILEYLNLAELQLSINKFCIEKAIPFSHDYDIFTSDEGAASVSALLFLNKQYDLMNEIKTLMKLSKMDIYCQACNLLSKEPPEKIQKFIKKLTREDRLDLLKALAMTNNRLIFFSVMYDCFDKKEQVYLFLDYNLIVDSLAIAYASKNNEIIPLIAHKAALMGDTRTVHECEKILSPK